MIPAKNSTWRRRLAVAALLLGAAGCGALAGGRKPAKAGPTWVSYPDAQVAGVKDPHAYQGQPLCQRCHTGEGGGLRAGPVALCKECHVQRHANHPVDIIQKKPLSKALPYGEGGRIVCQTCHDQHDLKVRKNGLRLAFNDLCMECHKQH